MFVSYVQLYMKYVKINISHKVIRKCNLYMKM